MSDERLFVPQVGGDELSAEKSLRPNNLEEFIGQRSVVENLAIAIATAKERGDVLDHVLLCGMPGLGKTTLSYLLRNELGVELYTTTGPALEKGKDIVGLLTNLRRGDILFIDEIHRMTRDSEEYLYVAMEDYKVDLVLDTGPDARTVRITVEPFTLVGATTREGLLTGPFRDRFGIYEKLELYGEADLVQIIERSARLIHCVITTPAAKTLARRCRGTPRFANRFLRRIRDVAQYRSRWAAEGVLRLDEDVVGEGLERLGVDENGLDRVDRKILEVLIANSEPVGVKTLAVSIGEEERTIEDVYEPYLVQRGLLAKTPRGRRATAKAFELYGKGACAPVLPDGTRQTEIPM